MLFLLSDGSYMSMYSESSFFLNLLFFRAGRPPSVGFQPHAGLCPPVSIGSNSNLTLLQCEDDALEFIEGDVAAAAQRHSVRGRAAPGGCFDGGILFPITVISKAHPNIISNHNLGELLARRSGEGILAALNSRHKETSIINV